ncbi:thioredoxin domain-containing protein [Candidatus Saccharibacteria bacterium]|nr:thioredoxin domain-containing protein [Candidatus Saccharibacteria bacterium]
MKTNRTLLISLIIIVALFIGAIIFIPQLTKKSGSGDEPTTSEVDISKYDRTKFIDANDDNGQIADHVKGDLKTAKVIIFEYADYQCSACALFQTWIEELVNEYKGEFAVIYRSYPLTSIHSNAIAAASAVEAAGLQGYWTEMGNLVFANQAEWFYATGDKRTNYFANYFTSVSNGKGDVAKFKEDMASDRVKAKVSFDKAVAESYDLTATPSFIGSDGKEIDFATDDVEQTKSGIQAFFRNYINKKLGK